MNPFAPRPATPRSPLSGGRHVPRPAFLVAGLLVFLALAPPAVADKVVLHDGKHLAGSVLTLDEVELAILLDDGKKEYVPRERVARIELDPRAKPAVRVEVKNLQADDALHLWVNERQVYENSAGEAGWVDVTDVLRDGANEMIIEILNNVGIWSYRLGVRVNGKATYFECGRPPLMGCTEGGAEGNEKGPLRLESVWLYYDERAGTVEVER